MYEKSSKTVLKYPLYFYSSITKWPYVRHSAVIGTVASLILFCSLYLYL